MEDAAQPVQYWQFKNGRWESIENGIIAEKAVSLTVNGDVWLTFLCTPVRLDALALGFLYNENLIQSYEDVASVRVCPTNDNVDVWLRQSIDRPKTWQRTSGCTGGFTSRHLEDEDKRVALADEECLSPEDIQSLIRQLLGSQELYRQVGGVHTSGLSNGKEILVVAEDIGRHNTLDKLAGICLLENIHAEPRVLITTGRISSEMLQKSARLGASIVVSRTSPSSLSVEFAERIGITLIGYAHHDRFNVYTYPNRVKL
jgi:FdhD protein